MEKNRIAVGAVLLCAFLLLTACGGEKNPATDTTGEQGSILEPGTGTDPVTGEGETMDVNPPEAAIEHTLIAHTLRVEGGKVVLGLSATGETGVAGTWVLSDASGVIAEQTVVPGETAAEVTFDCPADRINGELTLEGTAKSGDQVLSTVTLKLKDSLPQLTPDGIRCVIAAMTDEEKANLVVGVPEPSMKYISGATYPIKRLGVPSVLMMDGTAGIRYNNSVWYPSVLNVASSWDTALATRVGEALGGDTLAHGFDIVLAPGANLLKNPLGGRNFEYASEDPLLSGLMIAPYINGIESTGAGTSVKHFAVNNQETNRSTVSANLTERALREMYLKAFDIIVQDADPMTIMSSYNKVNGIYTSANHDLLAGILRGEFGYEGMVMSDWGAHGDVVDKINASNDIYMPGTTEDMEGVLAALKAGTLTDEAVNACCYRILNMVTESAAYKKLRVSPRVDFKNHGVVATEVAADSMVLLQNTAATLPLSTGTSVAVFGNGAFKTIFGGFGAASVNPLETTSIVDGLAASEHLRVVNNTSANPFWGCKEHDVDDPSKDCEVTEAYAAEMANSADVAIVVISRNSREGTDGYIGKGAFLLNDTEKAMMTRVIAAFHGQGKKVVVLINTGNPVEVVSWRDQVDAILWIGYPGQGAGTAVARVLSGEVNPSARTTLSWPALMAATPAAEHHPGNTQDVMYYEDIYVGYRYYSTFGVATAYPFGYGLSYTSFSYSGFDITINPDGTARATVTVTNTGSVSGREVVQIFVSKPETDLEQATRELAGFHKTALLEPGASETVSIDIRREALMSYVTASSRWVISAGTYTFTVNFTPDVCLDTKTVEVDRMVVVKDVENRCEPDTTLSYIQKEGFQVPDLTNLNLADGKATFTNFRESEMYGSDKAFDGDLTTRWSGVGLTGEPHILEVDLGEVYAIGEIRLVFEALSAPFSIYYSEDGQTYTKNKTYVTDETLRSTVNLYGKKARFVRLEINNTGLFTSVYEMGVYAATEADIEAGKGEDARVNLALNKTTISSTHEGSHVKENAVDGDVATRWSALPSDEGWLTVDLGKACHVTDLELIMEAAYVPYVVEYSTDGESYSLLRNAAVDELLVQLDDLDVEARYIRVRREGSHWFSICELAVYGEEIA